jgi:hypothetical protein
MEQDIEIIRWSGIWRNGSEVRVGVRLSDGRDALLVAFLGQGEDTTSIHYSLVIQGQDHDADFIIPTALEQRVEEKLAGAGQAWGARSLKDLKLF